MIQTACSLSIVCQCALWACCWQWFVFVEPEWALLIEHIWHPCFIDSPVLTVCTNGYHSVRICSNSQESLKDLLKYIYHLLHNVAPTGDAAITGVFLLNNGSIWTGRWMVIQSSVFFFFFSLKGWRILGWGLKEGLSGLSTSHWKDKSLMTQVRCVLISWSFS